MPARDWMVSATWSFRHFMRNQSIWVPGGVWSQGWNLKELTEGHHQEWSLRLNLTQHGATYQARTQKGLTEWWLFLDTVGGGAWPFLVGGVICLVNSVNERDYLLLISIIIYLEFCFFEEQDLLKKLEVCSNNRSVMPLDVLGSARATIRELVRLLSEFEKNVKSWNLLIIGLTHWNCYVRTRNI